MDSSITNLIQIYFFIIILSFAISFFVFIITIYIAKWIFRINEIIALLEKIANESKNNNFDERLIK